MKGIYRHILNVSFIMTTVWFSSCSNEENLGGELKELKTIKGIGNWTAKMYLLFALMRDNVLPYEDGAFLQGYKWLYNTTDLSKG